MAKRAAVFVLLAALGVSLARLRPLRLDFWDDWRSAARPATASPRGHIAWTFPLCSANAARPGWDSSAPSGCLLPVPNSRPDPTTS